MSPLYLLLVLLFAGTHNADKISDDILIQQVTVDDDNNNNEVIVGSHQHFTLFKEKYGKTYGTKEEHDYRFKIFKSNIARAKINQALDPTAVHGVNQFSDMTPHEFRTRLLGVRSKFQYPAHANIAPFLPTDNLPSSLDWRLLGAVTPVKNQGSCGSCWSFSTTGALEGAHFISTGELVSLSEQQLVDCDHECDPEGDPDDCDNGCDGGLMNNAFEYLLKSGGLMREDDYPYTARDGYCKFDKTKIAAKVANFSVIPVDEDQIAANLVKYGPLALGINANYMSTYMGGVSCPLACSKELDHGVLLVGYGGQENLDGGEQEKPYWIIKNSWGSYWGEDGYYRICRGYSACGVDTLVSSVGAVDVMTQSRVSDHHLVRRHA